MQTKQFKVVGTFGNLTNWQKLEKPFWEETLPKASGGKLTAPSALYEEGSERVVVDGPVQVRSATLRAEASGALIDLNAGRVDLTGPIRGRWEP